MERHTDGSSAGFRGTLGRNQKHEPGTNQPAYKGSCMLEDWISGWVNESESGKFFSLAFKPKEQQPKTDARPASGSPQLQAKYGSNGLLRRPPPWRPRRRNPILVLAMEANDGWGAKGHPIRAVR